MENKLSKRNDKPAFWVGAVSSRFSSVVCRLVGHKLPVIGFECCRCKTVLFVPPKTIEKKIEILVKDEYDVKYGTMLEYGIVSPFEYYKTKKFYIDNDFTF